MENWNDGMMENRAEINGNVETMKYWGNGD